MGSRATTSSAFRLGLAHAAFALSNRALYYVATLRDRPDVYHGSLAMYANDDENIAARGAIEVIQRSAGKASKDGKAALAAAHGEALRNTRINAGGLIADRLYARWAAASTALRETTDAAYAPSVAPLAPAPYLDDDDDDDLKAGACVMETQFDPRAGAGTLTTPWEQSPQGTFDDLLVALAVTGAPSAVLWLCPEAAKPIVQVMEWAHAVYPFPTSTDGASPFRSSPPVRSRPTSRPASSTTRARRSRAPSTSPHTLSPIPDGTSSWCAKDPMMASSPSPPW